MTNIWLYSILSILTVSLVSLVGVLTLPLKSDRLKNFLLYIVAFSAGAMIGDVFIHLLPETVEENGFGLDTSFVILAGIMLTFVTEKIVHVRHEHLPEDKKRSHTVSVMSLFGDGVHNFIDGLIVGASYLVSIPVGLATTIAVVLHEIPQEIGNFGVLLHGGFSKSKALFFNFLSALTAFLGLFIALSLSQQTEGVTKFLLPLAAGNFIYIAGSDLIPELHKEEGARQYALQFLMLLAGIFVMFLLTFLET